MQSNQVSLYRFRNFYGVPRLGCFVPAQMLVVRVMMRYNMMRR